MPVRSQLEDTGGWSAVFSPFLVYTQHERFVRPTLSSVTLRLTMAGHRSRSGESMGGRELPTMRLAATPLLCPPIQLQKPSHAKHGGGPVPGLWGGLSAIRWVAVALDGFSLCQLDTRGDRLSIYEPDTEWGSGKVGVVTEGEEG